MIGSMLGQNSTASGLSGAMMHQTNTINDDREGTKLTLAI
jgi:hypothetical protein